MNDDVCNCEGPGDLHPCDTCGKHSNSSGKPSFKRRVVRYVCPYCHSEMTRDIEDDLDDQNFVKVDLDDGVSYGQVLRVEGEQVLVALTDPPRTASWFDLWRLRDW